MFSSFLVSLLNQLLAQIGINGVTGERRLGCMVHRQKSVGLFFSFHYERTTLLSLESILWAGESHVVFTSIKSVDFVACSISSSVQQVQCEQSLLSCKRFIRCSPVPLKQFIVGVSGTVTIVQPQRFRASGTAGTTITWVRAFHHPYGVV